jgi:hypothetical protein
MLCDEQSVVIAHDKLGKDRNATGYEGPRPSIEIEGYSLQSPRRGLAVCDKVSIGVTMVLK